MSRRTVVWFAALAGMVLVIGGLILWGGEHERLDSFRRSGDLTIILEGERGEGDWSRVVSVDESPGSVTVVVRTLSFPLLPRSAVGYPTVFTIQLAQPLGVRTVTDGLTELPERP